MKFVSNEPAAIIGKALIVADLHLGIEFELYRKGVHLELQWPKAAKQLQELMKQGKCNELIIIGDAKHDIYGLEEREKQMMRSFFRSLLDSTAKKIIVCKGNHDGQLQELAAEGLITLVGPEGFVLCQGSGRNKTKYGLFHGHAWPSKEVAEADVLLMGHNHPLIELTEKLGFRWSEPAWIIGYSRPTADPNTKETKKEARKADKRKITKTIVFPAFNPLSGGIAFNTHPCKELLGPLFENELFELENAEARLLSGVSLGKIGFLRKFAPKAKPGRNSWKGFK